MPRLKKFGITGQIPNTSLNGARHRTTGGKFKTTMAAKDGSFSFDFAGVYTTVDKNKNIAYTMDDGRKVSIHFTDQHETTKVVESFEAETTHSVEMQRGGWQAILDNFKKYTETH